MMSVNTAIAAEEVLGRVCMKLVQAEGFLAFHDSNGRQRNSRDDGPLAAAYGAVASVRIREPIRQIHFQHHGTAMAGKPMRRKNLSTANAFGHATISF
jgi:hypothetical protein